MAEAGYGMKAQLLPATHRNKSRPSNSTAASQAVYLQSLVIQTTFRDDLKPGDVAGLTRAWCDVSKERRAITMKPSPRPVDVSKLKRGRGKAGAQDDEPTEAGPAETAAPTPETPSEPSV